MERSSVGPMRESLLLPRVPLILAAAETDGNWAHAASDLAGLAAVLRSPVADCLAAAAELERAMRKHERVWQDGELEVLFELRGVLTHLSTPSGASADARLAERNINAARPALRADGDSLPCALACSLLPTWAAALPLGPHWAAQMRVLLCNLLAVDANHASGVAVIAATNALVAITRHIAVSNPRCVSDEAHLEVSAVASAVAARLEATCEASTAPTAPMLGVSAGLGASTLLRDVALDEESSGRLLRAIAKCVDTAAGAAAADAQAEAEAIAAVLERPPDEWMEVEAAEEVVETAEAAAASSGAAPVAGGATAACAAVSAALPPLIGPAWGVALARSPSAALELVKALLSCEPDAPPSAFIGDETRLAASLLLSQFRTVADADVARATPPVASRDASPMKPTMQSSPLVTPPRPVAVGDRCAIDGYDSPRTVPAAPPRLAAERTDSSPGYTRAEVVPLIEEFAAARGVRVPPRGVVLPLPPA